MIIPVQNSQDTSIPLLRNTTNNTSEYGTPISPDSSMDPATSESIAAPASSESIVGNAANVTAVPSQSISQSLNSSLDRRWFRRYEQAMAIRGPTSAKTALAKRFHEEVYGAAANAQYKYHEMRARLYSKNPKKDHRARKRDITSSKESDNNNSSAASSLNAINPPQQVPDRSPASSQITLRSPSIGPVRRPRDVSNTSLSSNEEIIPPAPVVLPHTKNGNAHTNLGAPRRYHHNPQPATGRDPRATGDKNIIGG